MFSIDIDNLTLKEACEVVIQYAKDKNSFKYVVTPNVDHIIKLQKDLEFKKVYKKASLVLADGKPLVWASRLLKKPLKEKVSGSDLFPIVCKRASEENLKLFFLGGKEGVAAKAAKNLKKKHNNLNVVGVYSPPFGFENSKVENKKIVRIINERKPDILFVGLGAPKQEKWIYQNLYNIKVPVSLGIGASFDFEAGTIKRAPQWLQNIGFEWLWRFFQEPKRLFKRYFIEDTKFFHLLLLEILKKKQKLR